MIAIRAKECLDSKLLILLSRFKEETSDANLIETETTRVLILIHRFNAHKTKDLKKDNLKQA